MIGYSRRSTFDEYNRNEHPTVWKQGDDSKYGKKGNDKLRCFTWKARYLSNNYTTTIYHLRMILKRQTKEIGVARILASKDDLIFDL